MNLSCGSRTIKYLIVAFNLFFVLSGIIVIAIGAAAKTVYSEYADILDSQYFTLPNMLIATGVFIFMISFFGCCGAIKESWIMLGIFSILLCVIFIFEFASGIAGYVLRDKTYNYLDGTLQRDLQLYNTSTHAVWDLIQANFECCGVDSYKDWSELFPDNQLPVSCCPARSGTTGAFYCNYNNVTAAVEADNNNSTTVTPTKSTSDPYTTGCKTAFGSFLKKHAVQIAGCAMGLAIVQLLGILFSCHLVRQLKSGYLST